jgi:hypothetical protein
VKRLEIGKTYYFVKAFGQTNNEYYTLKYVGYGTGWHHFKDMEEGFNYIISTKMVMNRVFETTLEAIICKLRWIS